MRKPVSCGKKKHGLRKKLLKPRFRLSKNPFRGSCQRGRSPSDYHRIAWLCQAGGELSALPKTFLQSFGRKDRRQASFFDGQNRGLRKKLLKPRFLQQIVQRQKIAAFNIAQRVVYLVQGLQGFRLPVHFHGGGQLQQGGVYRPGVVVAD